MQARTKSGSTRSKVLKSTQMTYCITCTASDMREATKIDHNKNANENVGERRPKDKNVVELPLRGEIGWG